MLLLVNILNCYLEITEQIIEGRMWVGYGEVLDYVGSVSTEFAI